MVAERLYHPAVGGNPATAPPDDARKFIAEKREMSDLFLNLFQMPRRDAIGLVAFA